MTVYAITENIGQMLNDKAAFATSAMSSDDVVVVGSYVDNDLDRRPQRSRCLRSAWGEPAS